MEYRRDLAAGWSELDVAAEEEHVRAHLSAVADSDDDPMTRADEVDVYRIRRDDGGLSIIGRLDAEPDAPYLKAGYDVLAGVDPELYAAEVAAAVRDQEVLDGQA